MKCSHCQKTLSLVDCLQAYDQEEATARLEQLMERYSEEEKAVISKVNRIYEKTSLSYPAGRGKSQLPTNHLYREWDWISLLDWCSQYQSKKVIRGFRLYLSGKWEESHSFDRFLFSKVRNSVERIK